MKKILMVIVIGMVLFSISGFGKIGKEKYYLSAKGGFFLPTTEKMGEVYKYGLSFGIKFEMDLMRYAGLWVAGDYQMAKGELIITKDEVNLSMIPLKAGLRFFYKFKNITAYLAGGGTYVLYRETSDVEGMREHKENILGFVVLGGVKIRIRSIFLDIGVEYGGLQIPSSYDANIKIDAGRLSAFIALGFGF